MRARVEPLADFRFVVACRCAALRCVAGIGWVRAFVFIYETLFTVDGDGETSLPPRRRQLAVPLTLRGRVVDADAR